MIICELSVVPLGTKSTSLSPYVARVFAALRKGGFKPKLTPMGTIIEAEDFGGVLAALSAARGAVFSAGARRALISAKIDERRDRGASAAGKVKSVLERL